MFVTSNLGLTIWDSGLDYYDSSALANNWAILDQHDHTPGKGLQITGEAVQDGSITADKIAPGVIPTTVTPVITQSNIAANSVGSNQLIDGSVGPAQLAVMPSARATRSTNQTIPYNTITTIQLTTDYDSDSILNLTGTGTIHTAGIYLLTGSATYSPTTGSVELGFNINGTTYHRSAIYFDSAVTPTISAAMLARLSVSDVAQLETYTFTSGGLTLTSATFSVTFISP